MATTNGNSMIDVIRDTKVQNILAWLRTIGSVSSVGLGLYLVHLWSSQ